VVSCAAQARGGGKARQTYQAGNTTMSDDGLKIRWLDARREDVEAFMAELRGRLSSRGNVVTEASRQRTIEVFGAPLPPAEVVSQICREVARHGLSAVLDYTRRIDKVTLTAAELRVSPVELAEAHAAADPDLLAAVRRVRENIHAFQTAVLHRDVRVEVSGGYLVQRYRPLRRVGICVPGGAAAYPSTVLMTAVPAQVAGVEELAVVAPPTPFGAYNRHVLATCHELGIREVYRLGGAQAVAALAYGVEGLPAVDKIVGPGNLFVALAKKLVYGEVDIDAIAGPSEVVVIVDDTTPPQYAALDLLAQAEHAPGASILIGWQEEVLSATVAELSRRVAEAARGDWARQSLEDFAAVILAPNPEMACKLADQIAPEHLHIATANAEALAEKISHAGAIFLGNYAPVALGDYAAGPSHVLPTSGTARFASGLSANDFLRANSVLHFTREGLRRLAPDVKILAEREGLAAHWESVAVRLS
jgi:histidinol dehydrogenase